MSIVHSILYNNIRDRLKAKAPLVGATILYNSQYLLENEKLERVKERNTVYVEFAETDWENRIRNCQKGLFTIILHVVARTLNDRNTPIFDIVQQVCVALGGYTADVSYQPLKRIREEQNTDHDGMDIWLIHFQTEATDVSTTLPPFEDTDTITTDRDLIINKDLDIDNDQIRTGDGVF